MPHNNTNNHHANYTNSEFVCSLVCAITGKEIKDIPENNQCKVAQNCVVFFIDYIVDFIRNHYSEKDAIRIQTVYETGDDLFQTFPDLKEKYAKAYNSFISYLEAQNKLDQ